jgi:hypothetical protein
MKIAQMAKRTAGLLIAVALCNAVGGCGSAGRNDQSEEKASGPVLTLDPATVGEIKGTVTLVGSPPTLNPIDMGAAPPCLKLNPSPILPVVVTGGKSQLANVVISLKDGLGNYRFDTPKETATLDQKGCMYVPRVVALMANQPFEVQNDDPILHNVHAVLKQNRSWNHSQPIGGPPITVVFTRSEFAAYVVCNIHPWMRAYLFVFDNPYYAVTSTTGTFELKDVPPGTYTVQAWHERFGILDETVTIAPKETKAISFEFKGG